MACVLLLIASVIGGCSSNRGDEGTSLSKAAVTSQDPVNRNASAKARQVLRLLYDLPGRPNKKLISGQTMHVFVGGGYEFPESGGGLNPNVYSRIQDIHDQGGPWVGIAGAEYTDWFPGNGIMAGSLNPALIEHSRKGGIAELHFHPRNPVDPRIGVKGDWTGWWGPSGGGAQVTADLVLNPGPVHDRWMALLDAAAAGLRELRDNDVVVLWRPMHGRNAGGWWWSYANMPQADYNRIWAHMVDYFSNTWQLDNILYFQSWYFASPAPWGTPPIDAMYAGAENVDVVGVDHGEFPGADYAAEYAALRSFGKPFGISEGSIGESDGRGTYDMRAELAHIKNNWPDCAFFIQFDYDHDSPWADSYRLDIPGNLFGTQMLSDPWVMNAGELFQSEAPRCGDSSCNPGGGEDCSTCPQDCGTCGGACGDGACNPGGGEDCSTCPQDCGTCGAPYSLTATPNQVNRGDTVVVSWVTPPSGSGTQPWVGLFYVGSSINDWLDWQPANGAASGSLGFTIPNAPGSYEFRYFLRDYESAATSNPVSVP